MASKFREVNKIEEKMAEIRTSMYNLDVRGGEAEAYARSYKELADQADKIMEKL